MYRAYHNKHSMKSHHITRIGNIIFQLSKTLFECCGGSHTPPFCPHRLLIYLHMHPNSLFIQEFEYRHRISVVMRAAVIIYYYELKVNDFLRCLLRDRFWLKT